MFFDRAVTLGDLWYLQSSEKAKGTGEQISLPGFKIDSWYPAVVPSTVLGTLVENNVYQDIFFGKNLADVPKAPFQVSWWYRKEFTVPQGPGLTRARLEFDGVNYRANIWLNGKKVADAKDLYGAYRRFVIDITADAKSTEKNVLAVEVFPPKPGEPTVGWVDWNPAPPDNAMGLFREVRIRATGDVSVENPFVATKLDLAAFKEARLTVSADVVNHADADVTGTLDGQLEGRKFSREVTLRPGRPAASSSLRRSTPELVVTAPRVWWTHDLGSQELYLLNLSFTLKKDKAAEKDAPAPPPDPEEAAPKGKAKSKARVPGMPRTIPSDARSVRFGIREVGDYLTEQGHRGFTLNGRKVLIRGGGWADDLLLDVKPRKLAAEVLYARQMNLNALRLEGFWGTSQAFYDLCDRARHPGHGRLELPLGVGELPGPAGRRALRRNHHAGAHRPRRRVLGAPAPLAPQPPLHLRLGPGQRHGPPPRPRAPLHRDPEAGRPDPADPASRPRTRRARSPARPGSRCADRTTTSRPSTGTSTPRTAAPSASTPRPAPGRRSRRSRACGG
ncbi:MAG: hypothetical protein M0C28_48025 [Candidatus Moduliflexus flocculans]|nr:hypothetical protein [Candidatus Moduliflexus flocculans]